MEKLSQLKIYYNKIDAVTVEDLLKLSKEILDEKTLSRIIICSKDNSIKKAA